MGVCISNYIDSDKKKLIGTFQLNGSVAIHSWYNYLAGYSAEFVQQILLKEEANNKFKVLDPFCGVGTTNIVCKKNNIFSVGYEVNPFTHFVCETKLNWNLDEKSLHKSLKKIEKFKETTKIESISKLEKAFSPKILKKLLYLRKAIDKVNIPIQEKNFFLLALISMLRQCSNYESFSPYLKKRETELEDYNVKLLFQHTCQKMIADLKNLHSDYNADTKIYLQSAKQISKNHETFDLVITSPPYLNNWDYSWITKIELDFLDFDNTKFSRKFREELVKSSTYLVKPNQDLLVPDGKTRNSILHIANRLEQIRIKEQKGKKYDLAVIQYFNDIYEILKAIHVKMKKGGKNYWVIGDSGLYGIHVKTDVLIGNIAEEIGFKNVRIEKIRDRFASRHKIPLRETIVSFEK
jgi:DNA modification methylase